VRDKAKLACMPVRDVTDRTDSSAGELVDPGRRGELVEDMSSLAESILEQIADAVIYADDTGTIMRWNQAAADLFGYSAAEALGQNLDLIIPEHLRAAHWRGFEAAMTNGATKLQGRPTLTRATHQTGRRLYVEMTFALVKGQAGGGARAAVAVARDVTERIEQQRADARRDSSG
jgi:PAS domain S-box-containing protein